MIEWILSSSVLIVMMMALRFLLKGRIHQRLQYALWGLVLLRLLIPVNLFDSGMSILNAAPKQVISQAEEQISAPIAYASILLPTSDAAEKDAVMPETAETETGHAITIEGILKALWLAGSGIVGLTLLFSNLHYAAMLRKVREAVPIPCKLQVFVTQAVETPCLFGLFHPAVYLPPEAASDTASLPHVLAHELTHYRHGDHIWSLLRCVCLALHWYNPLVWLAAAVSRQDAELACDEGAIAALGEDQRVEYGKTLIRMAFGKRATEGLILTATTMTGSKKLLQERIKRIAKSPKMAFYTRAVVALAVAVALGCTFTGAPSQVSPTLTAVDTGDSDTTVTEEALPKPDIQENDNVDFADVIRSIYEK